MRIERRQGKHYAHFHGVEHEEQLFIFCWIIIIKTYSLVTMPDQGSVIWYLGHIQRLPGKSGKVLVQSKHCTQGLSSVHWVQSSSLGSEKKGLGITGPILRV